MHRNTAIIISLLAVISALLIGINIGRSLNSDVILPSPSPDNLPFSSVQGGQPTPSPSMIPYTHQGCGIEFAYDPDFTLTEASDAAGLEDKITKEKITLLCGNSLPRPPLPPERIEEASVAGQPATVYHDTQAQDGQPVDVIIFTHPTKLLEIALFGFGQKFQQLLNSLKLLP